MIYSVRNWRQFQHYRDRNPPWIKLHFSLLSSTDWVMLDDASRALAIAIMLIASRSEGKIDGSEGGLAYLQRVAYIKHKPDIKPLINCGFLVLASDCKQMLADARPETETETETENRLRSQKGSRLQLEALPEDWKNFAVKERQDLDPSSVFEQFRDYWTSVPGAKGVKLDWFATWRNWVRNQKATVKGNGGAPTDTACAICHGSLSAGHTRRREGAVCNNCEASR